MVDIKPVNFTTETPVGADFVLWVNATKERKVTVANFLAIAHNHVLSQITDVTITAANLNILDDGLNTTLHFHDSDRARANHTGSQAISTITGLQTALDAKQIDLLTNYAGSGLQVLRRNAGNTDLEFATVSGGASALNDLTDVTITTPATGHFLRKSAGDWVNVFPVLADVSDVTITAANLNILDDGADTTLHFHASDRARANHTGTQLLSTISDVSITSTNLNILDDGVDTTLHFHAADRARANHTGTQDKATITGLPWLKADLPSAIAYEDETNTFTQTQTYSNVTLAADFDGNFVDFHSVAGRGRLRGGASGNAWVALQIDDTGLANQGLVISKTGTINSGGDFALLNNTNVIGEFQPLMRGMAAGATRFFKLQGAIALGDDTGSVPVTRIGSSRVNSTDVVTRPLFAVTKMFSETDVTIWDASGNIDFTDKNLTSIGTGTISALTEEVAPTTGDFILVHEATSNAMRKVDIGNLPTGGGGEANTISSQGGGTFALTAATPKSGVDLRVISVSNGAGMNASLATDILTLAVDSTVVKNDQANTYAAAQMQTFQTAQMKLNNAGFAAIFATNVATTDKTITFANVTGTVLLTAGANTVSGKKTFTGTASAAALAIGNQDLTSGQVAGDIYRVTDDIRYRNNANNANITILGDTTTNTVTAKTLVLANNTITDTSAALGDIVRFDSTRFARFARGADGTFLRATATDIAYQSVIFSKGGTVLDPAATARNIIAWRAPFACTVTNVRGYRTGGSAASVNARRNGSSNHLASNLSLATPDAWADGGAVQNTAYVAGDKLEIMIISTAGSPTEVAIQVDYTRP